MKLNIEGEEYNLNIQRAEELGVLTKVKPKFILTDLKINDVFKFRLPTMDKFSDAIYLKASSNNYVMLYGGGTWIANNRAEPRCWFAGTIIYVAILNVDTGIYEESK